MTETLRNIQDVKQDDLQYVAEVNARRRLDDLILPDCVRQACDELVEEQQRVELLRSHCIEPRHRVLLTGPPGNGKTSLAEALAGALMVPFFIVRYDVLIGSYLGETATRLARLFDFVRTRHCVLFLDEFETLGKERGDTHETGEIKRVVSSLLLQVDDLPSHVVIVTATNHPELLDRAVWRRFQLRLELPPPGIEELQQWFERFESEIGEPLGLRPKTLADDLVGISFAEAEEFCAVVLRRRVLDDPDADVPQIVRKQIEQWNTRAHVE